MKLTLATRGSPLALWQAHATRDAFGAWDPDVDVEVLTVESSGDKDQASALARFGRIGIFTVQVDEAVIDGRADVAVHSMKDMTTTLQDGVVLAGALPRGPIDDALVSRDGKTLDQLPAGARVATGSMRRRAMVLRARPDVEVTEIRGNVGTRLSKLEAGEADALVMACAGLERLGLGERITERLTLPRFVPAVSQGIVGLTCRVDDERARQSIEAITDRDAWTRALAERALLRTLHGGCNAPIGGHARLDGERLSLVGCVLGPDGGECVEGALEGSASEPDALGERLAHELLERGAGRLVEMART